jgi:hypothetical protein
LPAEGAVQLIVFVAAIREILKKEIYGQDKQCFCSVKTKGQFGRVRAGIGKSQMSVIRFVNSLASRMTQGVPWRPSVALVPVTPRKPGGPNGRGN